MWLENSGMGGWGTMLDGGWGTMLEFFRTINADMGGESRPKSAFCLASPTTRILNETSILTSCLVTREPFACL